MIAHKHQCWIARVQGEDNIKTTLRNDAVQLGESVHQSGPVSYGTGVKSVWIILQQEWEINKVWNTFHEHIW